MTSREKAFIFFNVLIEFILNYTYLVFKGQQNHNKTGNNSNLNNNSVIEQIVRNWHQFYAFIIFGKTFKTYFDY